MSYTPPPADLNRPRHVAGTLMSVVKSGPFVRALVGMLPPAIVIGVVCWHLTDSALVSVAVTMGPLLALVAYALIRIGASAWKHATDLNSWAATRFVLEEAQVSRLEDVGNGNAIATIVGFKTTIDLLDADLSVVQHTVTEGADQCRIFVPAADKEHFVRAADRGEVGTVENYHERTYGPDNQGEVTITLTLPSLRYSSSNAVSMPQV